MSKKSTSAKLYAKRAADGGTAAVYSEGMGL